MSVQILLQGRLLGAESFLLAGGPGEIELAGRFHWVNLLAEVLPRALIAELGLSKMLLGSSGGEQFLVVLPEEVRPHVEEFLTVARADAAALSGGTLRVFWSITENLGDWSDVRKRLNEEMRRKTGTPFAGTGPLEALDVTEVASEYFGQLGLQIREAHSVGWSPESPARIEVGGGKHTWTIGSGPAAGTDSISMARHAALNDDDPHPASTELLAARSEGRAGWGVLRGDVDDFGIRARRVQTIEEHVQVSVLYKQFFAGELEVLCSMGAFWRKVTLLYSGGDDFALYGSWDALIAFARELQRLFQRFAEENLKDYPGPEAKTITMAIEIAPDAQANLASLYGAAGRQLELAKSSDKDCVHLFGRTLEWKQLADAQEIRDDLTRMVTEFGAAPQYIRELTAIYRETRRPALPGEKIGKASQRPWRFYRRLNRILGVSRAKDFQKARAALVTDLAGRNPANLKLRPSGRVALEWARLSTEGSNETVGSKI